MKGKKKDPHGDGPSTSKPDPRAQTGGTGVTRLSENSASGVLRV